MALAAAAAGLAGPYASASPEVSGASTVRVERFASSTLVRVSDLARLGHVGAAATLYCAVRDNTFGCQQGTPGDGLVVARLYYGAGATGSQVVVFNPAYQVGCSGGTADNEGGANLGAAVNQISSVRTYNSCDVKLFDGDNLTGEASAWLDNANVGALNDRANSFRIS
ncbi:hypothetical protein BJP25_21405 [Actinokineospora bangkokensis]|uniref:Uncharacterized protein n=1 Tax=Actinokineospora bangkokensis TaxID=1193682 RepID=A0A1Q9LKV2_9PSEU|nr:hypothetical protein BJP25_21405 [Actinokineospora bangkokensis]